MKKRRGLRILGFILLVIILFFAVINIIPPKKNVADNPFIVGKGNLPMIAAHRGGGDNNPENTLLAFREAVETVGVDIIESDLYLTKDGYLVYNHDSYIDETCNVNGDISLDEPLNVDWDGNELLLSDILGTDADIVCQRIERVEERRMVRESVAGLAPREREIIELRFGLNGGRERTQKEVADMLGISQSYI